MARIVRIVSNGTSTGTHVYLDSGEKVTNITKIEFNPLESGKILSCSLTFVNVAVDLLVKTDSLPDEIV